MSKILKQKDKILSIDNGNQSPRKRTKGKIPNIEKALSTKQSQLGLILNDDRTREKTIFFAHIVRTSEKVNSGSRLEEIKQRNYLNENEVKAQEVAYDSDNFDAVDGIPISEPKSGSETPDGMPPVPPDPSQHFRSPKLAHVEPLNGFIDCHKPTTSLTSYFPETALSISFPPGIGSRSSTSSFISSDLSCGLFTGDGAFVIEPPVFDPPPIQYSHSLMAPVLEYPLEEMGESPLGIDFAVNHFSQQSHHIPSILSPSSLSMNPPPKPPLSGQSSPNPPSQEEALRALRTIIDFFKNQPTIIVDRHEYILIGKLMERLKPSSSRAYTSNRQAAEHP